MEKIKKSIQVDQPINTVYNQWTQFEEFPRFMEGVQSVRQLDDRRLHWCATVAGKDEEWDAEIVEGVGCRDRRADPRQANCLAEHLGCAKRRRGDLPSALRRQLPCHVADRVQAADLGREPR